ncbi:hypothetical protein CONPUDRAFT_165871 [Coniophora puteana RWD-64-598 SS2]|uniref:Uncharacterized protein n=1 Tax=Coniophora puteana (strain RWD-64-598) TaxID=741705 RepID=A0A5M3MNK1_CONPW|nr:uncharacterized protein CONPUDRAFT_165871 [Coniophora puteana RWD-64-598 SS2]EIW80305.1 hypothetical protein CONPUDRAFT_165871 [Coniophora puteana RWD-64-598 SS2]
MAAMDVDESTVDHFSQRRAQDTFWPAYTLIDNLPNEILLTIFQLLFDEDRERRKADTEYYSKEAVDTRNPKFWKWKVRRPKCTTLFPLSPAAVCHKWRAVLAMEPAFWTRVVIFVDKAGTPASFIPEYFAWSRDKLIDVEITRRQTQNGWYRPDDEHESARVEHVMMHLQHHLHRCKSIRLYIKYRTSLLDAVRYLVGEAPHLRRLELYARNRDTERKIEHQLVCPALPLSA